MTTHADLNGRIDEVSKDPVIPVVPESHPSALTFHSHII
ncbi:hypothetical protein SAMN05421870_118113 [Streptomyces qinglanensis]|uniref:Uncharacterized protein n=1 Tax=Streptomyces qinglanensis TaxID=943816 RepID=A0A1H9WKJ2_9ACTN|nr:hypothetical protein SAMN05421870_118113 [Streptomyces qinglanensis]